MFVKLNNSVEFLGKKAFKGVNRAAVSVTPDYSNGVVALFHHVCWVHIFRHLVNLKNLSSIYFIDASSAFALYP